MSKNEIKIVTIFAFFSIVLSILIFNVNNQFFKFTANDLAIENAQKKVNERERLFQSFLNESRTTLYALRDFQAFNDFLSHKVDKVELEKLLLSFMKTQTNFMQLRFIDKNGQEIIRINRDKPKVMPYLVRNDLLQNKSKRYYFMKSKEKKLEHVWFSQIDLNKENGKVETPYRPTLRAMLPIKHINQFDGILMINYFMGDFIHKLTDTPLYDLSLFNDKGFTLAHYYKDDHSKCWGNSLEHKYNIISEKNINLEKLLDVNRLEDEKFYAKRFDVDIDGGLNIFLKLKESYFIKQEEKQLKKNLVQTLIILLFTFVVGLIIYRIFRDTLFNLNEVRSLNRALNRETQKFKALIEYASEGIAILSVDDGKVIIHSKALENLLGYDEQEINNLSILEWDNGINSLSDYKSFIQSLEKKPITIERKHITKDKKVFHALVTMVRINIDGEDVIYYSTKDITEIKEKDKMIFEQSKMASMAEMIGNIAHQWRQPLSNISISSTSLLMRHDLKQLSDEDLIKGLNTINDTTQYLSNVIDTFNLYIDKDKEVAEFDIVDTLHKALFLTKVTLEEKKINLIEEISTDGIVKVGLEDELSQVFINIIKNSIDAIDDAKEESYLKVITSNDDKKVKIVFEDNGKGIALENIDKIFEPYYTTKHQSQGTGLGLHIAYKIIKEQFNGNIFATYKEDGTIITLEIPYN